MAVAVHPTMTYLKVKLQGRDSCVIAERRAEAVLGKDFEVLERMKGADLIGLHYEPPVHLRQVRGQAPTWW